jgi:hypothetical protein
MKLEGRRAVLKGALTLIPALVMRAAPALAASAAEIDREVDAAIKKALQAVPETRDIVAKSKGVLIVPRIYKAGFMFGAQYGEGAMRKKGTTVGYYNSVAASYGFQAGVQSFGYMLFFLTDHAVTYLEQSGGFELGSGPSLVVPGNGQVVLDLDGAEGHRRDVLRSEGADGRHRAPGVQAEPHEEVAARAYLGLAAKSAHQPLGLIAPETTLH